MLHDVLVGVDPAALVFARFAAATLVLVPAALAISGLGALRAAWPGGAVAGVCAALGFVFQAVGLRHTGPGTSAFLTGLGSLVAGLLAWPLLGHRPGVALAIGIAAAGIGVALMTGPALTRVGSGEAWTVLGALAFGLQIVALARFAPRADPLALTAVQAATLALVVAPFGAAHFAGAWRPAGVLPRFGYLVVAGSIAAPLLQVRAQRVVPPGRAGVLLGLEPLFAIVIALACGVQRPRAAWWGGATLILLAVTLVEWSAARRAPASPRPATG